MECCIDLTMSSSEESDIELNINVSTSEEDKSSDEGSPEDSVIFVDETESSTQEGGVDFTLEISSTESDNNDTFEGSSEAIIVVDSPIQTEENSVKCSDHVPVTDLSCDAESSSAGPSRQKVVCSVCLEDIEKLQLGSIKCGHTFCVQCIKSLLANGDDHCPKCRMQFRAEDIRSVYL